MRSSILAALALAVGLVCSAAQGRTMRVYFVGNSVTDTINYGGLDAMAEGRGHSHIWGRHMIPGAPLEWIWDHPGDGFQEAPFGYYPNALPNYEWDVVSLQPFDRLLDSDLDYAGRYIDLTRSNQANSDTVFYIYSRWPRKNEDGTLDYDAKWLRQYTGGWDGTNETRDYFEELLNALRNEYPSLSGQMLMVPVGDVLYELNQRMKGGHVPGFTDIAQFYSDGIHFNNVGSFAVGTTYFATLYKENPAGMAVPSAYGAIDAAVVAQIQDAAWDIVSTHAYSGVVEANFAPEPAAAPSPSDAAVNVGVNVTLSWTAGARAASHDVYFGTDANGVASADNNSPAFKGNQTAPSCSPGLLEPNSTYFWRIDEKNSYGTTAGPAWSFTTGARLAIAFGAVSSAADNDDGGSTLVFSHTIGDANDRILITGIGAEDTTEVNLPIVSVTYNGVAMTGVPGSTVIAGTAGGYYIKAALYYMLEEDLPAAGTYDVNVSFAGPVDDRAAGAISLHNVDQVPPEAVAATSDANSPTIISTDITTLTGGAWVVDVAASGDPGTFTPMTTGMTERYDVAPFSSNAAGSTMPVWMAGTASMSWQHSTPKRMAHAVAAFAPASASFAVGDLDYDHQVNLYDLRLFCDQWLTPGPQADFDDSTSVDFADLALMGQSWGL